MVRGRVCHGIARECKRSAGLKHWVLLVAVMGTLFGPVRVAAGAGAMAPLQEKPGLPFSAYLPVVTRPYLCPSTSGATFDSIPYNRVRGDNRSAAAHADLNLALRGYARVSAPLQLVWYDGDTHSPAPQMTGLFANGQVPTFTAAYQVYDWNWACGPDGCRGALLNQWPATLLGMRTTPGEPIRPPSREAEIYGGGYTAIVLYADISRITLKYTREDTVVSGYTVHIEGLCVDPNLLALYRSLDAQGRPSLPALRNGETLGVAAGADIAVAIRDTGTFMDPRSRKDWWLLAR